MLMTHRVAVDIGGTFTDLVSLDLVTGTMRFAKSLTIPQDLGRGVMEIFSLSGTEPAAIRQFIHGSTVIINAILERKGAPTALLTTRGFRDVLEIGRANRPDMYNFLFTKQRPFVERRDRFEIDERMDSEGTVLRALNEADVLHAAEACAHAGIASVAVCYLHSYANPSHEIRTKELLQEASPSLNVTMGHELTREWREYERTSTAVLNAFVKPLARGYLTSLERELDAAGVRAMRLAMQSNGGTTTFANARELPIQLVESGPVAGVIGAAVLGRAIGEPNVLSLDIGGTTAKASLIQDGEVKVNTDYRVESGPFHPGYPIRLPVVDIVEIGAGGGSIARFQADGSIRVGPDSAGADPGPACYGRGGQVPTLTDANLIAGRINPDYFLGGQIRLDRARAVAAVGRLARDLGLSLRETALGIIRVANHSMTTALRMVSVRRGYDPRRFGMVVMGGGGPLHAAYLAAELGVRKAIVPRAPAHFSAWGMLVTDLRHDFAITKVMPWSAAALGEVQSAFEGMEERADALLEDEGVPSADVRSYRFVDMRYEGQEHTVTVPMPTGRLKDADRDAAETRFHALHEFRYTFRLADAVEIVNIRVTVVGHQLKPELRLLDGPTSEAGEAQKETRDVDFDDEGILRTSVFERDRLAPRTIVRGPAVIEEAASATLVYPGQVAEVDRFGNLLIHREGGT
jgi:N-methylhydantoinase A